ncbi:DeoR family fructose operon transcriptional repressor [Virgibacillus natechei]|uniref:DeoR family fructose operon transcriptional repressor n=1 Tax=Virgibacillus natechei TaxID=1216297 RepID=A0ABS4IC35_9BACI|nr:DeoR/GlpR family DNA-binding transcription regulator [Virgibacillus natechei]MBP1968494.1 DeoR family fructose operon transcriptional repressor [Virgibacillus natechei]UZD13612.1 DeoR/GlpR family DNA-binding transcription regulator [Virgibacillus natechei]
MLTTERHAIIIDLLKQKQTITIQEITEITAASESTIRRDLTELERQNKLARIHGGATWTERKQQELSVSEKSSQNLEAKMAIAKEAASLVQNGDCIYLDAGTTTFQMIPYLKEKDIVVVTNGLTHIESLIEHEITSYLTGGKIKMKTRALIGPQAVQNLQRYRFDKCFIGINGFKFGIGYTTPDPEEAIMKQTAQNLSNQSYVLTDHSKYQKTNFAKISELEDATIITSNLSESDRLALQKLTTVRSV